MLLLRCHQARDGGVRTQGSMNEGVRIAEVVRGGTPRPPESEVAKTAVPQHVPGAQGGGMIGATADDDIGRTACRLAEEGSHAQASGGG